jgi:hypothetical protein
VSELPEGPRTFLVGRPAYEPDPDAEHAEPEGRAIPSGCLRKLNVPHGVCEMDCPGRQRDGGCFAELVRGRSEWTVELDRDGYWVVT